MVASLVRATGALVDQQVSREWRWEGRHLGRKDHLIRLIKPVQRPDWMSVEQHQQMPKEIFIREIRAGKKVLITTMTDPALVSRKALKDLYRSRWHVELDIRNIKTTLGMETLSCKTPEMAEKEMWVYFLAYNLIRIVMAQSAALAKVLPQSLSFKHTLQLWLAWRQRSTEESGQHHLIQLFYLIAARRVDNRSRRLEPRAVKRRPKPTPLLTRSREEERARIRKHGHPPKQREWNKLPKVEAAA